jgi:multisubunit Na+/H+ antiporter MnhG subunit
MHQDNGSPPSLHGLVALGTGVGAAGCLTPILIFGAILLGRQLDRLFGTEPAILLALIFLSIPLSLYLAARAALDAVNLEHQRQTNHPSERSSDSSLQHSSESNPEDGR